MWREVKQAKDDNKREIKLSGAEISERIDKDGLDNSLFALESLNLLNISDTSLRALPLEISNLINLQTLLLYGNEITSIPDSIGRLDKLKVLDLSRNQVAFLPDTITQLHSLTTINISNNKLTTFPSLKNFAKLSVIDLSSNELDVFPDIYSDNSNLSEVYLKENKIEAIPHSIDQLVSLKHFNLAKNQVKKIPKSLANISKLKDLDLSENPVADKRLLKLIQQCRTKQVLDYVKQHGENAPKNQTENDSSSNQKSGKSKKSKKSESSDEPKHTIRVNRHTDETVQVIYDDSVKNVRQFILCCIAENVNLTNGKFREFLQLQTKLHETVCGKREKSTIATHDLGKLPRATDANNGTPFIRYTAKEPIQLKIQPLGKSKVVTALELYNELKSEAEAIRKQTKRNTYSGIHKYLKLLENQPQFSCVEDSLGGVISLPPLTNGETTKISPESTKVLIEITSHSSMSDCVATMEALLKGMLTAGLGTNQNSSSETTLNFLEIRQVKVTDAEGNLRRVYPAKSDLVIGENENVAVERE